MAVETISLDRVEKNPYRDLVGHPIPEDQLETLKASIELTGFWEGLLVRPHPRKPGRYQLAFGHARWEAAKAARIKAADFIVHEIDDDAMIRAMADENISQFGRDEYATYREAVTAAAERIMGSVIAGEVPKIFSEPHGQGARNDLPACIQAGDAPGIDIISRYFKGSLPLGPIRMALKEYRESGKLGAWHRAHNPQAAKLSEPPTLNSEALGKFNHVVHVQAFAKACQEAGVPYKDQPRMADHVLQVLKDPEPSTKAAAQGAKARKRNVDYQRTERPRNERLTAHNTRRVVTEAIGRQKETKEEREAMEAQAYAISIESALTEASIGLKRAAKAADELARVAKAIGGMHIDMTPIARNRLADCIKSYREIEASLRAAQQAGPHSGIRRLTND